MKMLSGNTLVFDIRTLTKEDREEAEKLQLRIQRNFGFMPARYFVQDPYRAQRHLSDIMPRRKRPGSQRETSEQKQVRNDLDTFIEKTSRRGLLRSH
jgi:hypothetical protein